MPQPDTKRGNTWTLTLKLEDSADLAAYIADPNDGWPLIEDEGVMLAAVTRRFRGGVIDLANGGRVAIVDLELSPPDPDEFLTERKYRNEVAAEQGALFFRTEWPQDARAALGMVLSAWEYLWRANKAAHGRAPARDARLDLQEAAYDIRDAASLTREEASDLEEQASLKWARRERLGMLDQKGATQ